jgi:hypothetical protein
MEMAFMNDREKENETAERFGWKDILAFSVALYQILLPQLLLIFLAFIAASILLFVFWFR